MNTGYLESFVKVVEYNSIAEAAQRPHCNFQRVDHAGGHEYRSDHGLPQRPRTQGLAAIDYNDSLAGNTHAQRAVHHQRRVLKGA